MFYSLYLVFSSSFLMTTKRAILIGFNYKSSSCPLSGCWNDVKNVKSYLLTKGYDQANITLITDEETSDRGKALDFTVVGTTLHTAGTKIEEFIHSAEAKVEEAVHLTSGKVEEIIHVAETKVEEVVHTLATNAVNMVHVAETKIDSLVAQAGPVITSLEEKVEAQVGGLVAEAGPIITSLEEKVEAQVMAGVGAKDGPSGASVPLSKDWVLDQMMDFIETVQPGDQLFFHYSGHGGQLPDTSGDEPTGMDDCIYSGDLTPITDDNLRKVLVDTLPAGAKLVVILDCCHSGTGMDLPYVKGPRGTIIENKAPVTNEVYCLSACQDDQTAADTSFGRIPQGALTHAFLDVMTTADASKKPIKWITLVNSVMRETRTFNQKAQLSMNNRYGYMNNIDF